MPQTSNASRVVVRLVLLAAVFVSSGCDVLLCLTTGLCREDAEPDDDACFLCSADERCADGRCIECEADDECQSGVCEADRCVECRRDAECSGTCIDNVCVECGDDSDCDASAVCIDDGCVEVACSGIADPTCTALQTNASRGYLCSTSGTCADPDDITGCETGIASRSGGPLLLRASLTRADDDRCDERVAYTASFAAVAEASGSRVVASVVVQPFTVDAGVVALSSEVVEDEEVGEALLCLPADDVVSGLLVEDAQRRRSNTVCLAGR